MKLRVLLVEDNALNSELACDLLTIAGHEIALARSGAALRSLMATGVRPDIVLLDILLPDSDGFALLAELRASDKFAGVPIVALTAQALAGDEARMLTAGFTAVITKPIDTRMFAADVARLAHSRAR